MAAKRYCEPANVLDFGRDTLIALRLLLPVLSTEATESILAAVIQRTNMTSGELCHEETVGDYASFLSESEP